MTTEEAIKRIHRFVETYKICGKDNYNPTTNITKLDYEAFKTAIESLEQTRWIPVSERLPEEDGIYLATCDGEICGEDEPFSGLAEFENGKWIDDEEGYQCVLAWQPLPQPYKAESEE